MSEDKFIYIKKNWCKRCNICIEFCPKGVYKKGEDGYPVVDDIDKCSRCYICVAMCPDFAILVEEKTVKLLKDR